jgi:hypothetical protein
LYLTCPCSSCWRIHILYIFLVIHCYIIQNMYPPTRWARAGKIQIDCIITMDDQEDIQNMYPPTRRARAGTRKKYTRGFTYPHILHTGKKVRLQIRIDHKMFDIFTSRNVKKNLSISTHVWPRCPTK